LRQITPFLSLQRIDLVYGERVRERADDTPAHFILSNRHCDVHFLTILFVLSLSRR